MREVGPELSRVIHASRYFRNGCRAWRGTEKSKRSEPRDAHPKQAKTPARSQASGGGHCREAILRTRVRNRAKSWTLNSVADAKRSATRSSRVASCLLHTLLLS